MIAMPWTHAWQWPDGHRVEPYGSGDFVPVCPTHGRGHWMVQVKALIAIESKEAQCGMCGAVLQGPAVPAA